MRPDALCGLLAEPDRLAVFAAVVLGARTPAEVGERTGLADREVVAALRRLVAGGLVGSAEVGLVADVSAFKEAVREYAPADVPRADPGFDRKRAAVMRAFVRDGRIVQMPAARGKRRVLLEQVVTAFEPGVRYPERVLDEVLRGWHADHASLRRYLIDEGLMSRENGVYWRTGGFVDPAG